MEKICGIYKITSPLKKVYIGQSIDIKNRWWKYKHLKCENQSHLYNSLKKYGTNRHRFEIIHQCDKSELNELEKYYIELFQCFDNEYGLNLKAGGEGGGICSEETKEKLRKSHLGQIAHNKGESMSKEQYEKCKNTMFKSGGIGIRTGIEVTKETREKMRKAKLNISLSEEHKRNIGKGVKKFRNGNNNLPEPSKENLLELIYELKKFTVIDQKRNLSRLLK